MTGITEENIEEPLDITYYKSLIFIAKNIEDKRSDRFCLMLVADLGPQPSILWLFSSLIFSATLLFLNPRGHHNKQDKAGWHQSLTLLILCSAHLFLSYLRLL